jgi:hypothetical protein
LSSLRWTLITDRVTQHPVTSAAVAADIAGKMYLERQFLQGRNALVWKEFCWFIKLDSERSNELSIIVSFSHPVRHRLSVFKRACGQGLPMLYSASILGVAKWLADIVES